MRIASIVILLCLPFVIYLIMNQKSHKKELFTNAQAECPNNAKRSPEGKIIVQPGNKTFNTMNEYLEYLNTLYANGSKCIPPKVLNNDQVIPGVLLNYNPTEDRAYSTAPINKLDDYEYQHISDSTDNTRNAKSDAMNTIRTDWANLPFKANARSKEEDSFVASRLEDGRRDPETGVFFKTVEGSTIVPPDTDIAKEREQKILSSYRPTDITKNDETNSVAKLVNAMYKNDPMWEPVVTRVSDHQWEISEIRPKARKEKYEEEVTKTNALSDEHMKPSVTIDDHNRLDPYFDKTGISDKDNNRYWKYEDFRKWTPGLERMFAPTLPNKEWE